MSTFTYVPCSTNASSIEAFQVPSAEAMNETTATPQWFLLAVVSGVIRVDADFYTLKVAVVDIEGKAEMAPANIGDYIVKLADTYLVLPKTAFELLYCKETSQSWQGRLEQEKVELKKKADKLLNFLQGNPQSSGVSKAEITILKEQWEAMMWYYSLLDNRQNLHHSMQNAARSAE